MEISVFSKCIKSLIGDHDRVEVPGLGVFFAEQVPSTFSEQLNVITPPSRRMYFEKAEVEPSAGALIFNHISSELGVSSDQAEVELSWCLGRIRSELDGNRICILPGLGQMKATSQHDYFFVPDDNLDICPESFGLTPVCLRQNAEAAQLPAEPAAPVAEPVSAGTLPELSLPEEEQDRNIRSLYEERAKAGLLDRNTTENPVQEPATKPAPEPVKKPEAADRKRISTPVKILIVFGILLLLAVIAAILLTVLPDSIVDPILYSPEELRIIHLSQQ